ncbi:MAG: DUF3568 family protein [Pirellulales bacterium]
MKSRTLESAKRAALACCAAAVAACLSGCVAAAVAGGAAGAAGVAYVRGDVERTYPYPIDTVAQATHLALAELELPVTHAAKDQLKGHIEARTATGDRIQVRLQGQGAVTELRLRVNTFGDKTMSSAVIAKIDQYLPAVPAAGAVQPADAAAPASGSPVQPTSAEQPVR